MGETEVETAGTEMAARTVQVIVVRLGYVIGGDWGIEVLVSWAHSQSCDVLVGSQIQTYQGYRCQYLAVCT